MNEEEKKGVVSFLQYLRPDGRTRPAIIYRPMDIVKKANELFISGFRFETEVLLTGEVSLTVVDGSGVDRFVEVVPNGPEVPGAVDKLITRAYDVVKGG